ncbi:MAG TPA: glycosyltransferase family 2 protein [Puia sp.]|nr:glycosyltransferase family 2 protein [Puia sp.]
MDSPFFSVIIPTRNRYETLEYALKTVLDQEFISFELIISDNSDTDQLDGLGSIRYLLEDKRIKYCRPPSVLSMSDNWEFAVSQAGGEFIIIFGDDDGLVSGALKNIHDIVKEAKVDLISWARVEYSWPDRMPRQYSNLMIIPYVARTGVIDSNAYIKKVIAREADYRYLPMFYNSAVRRSLVDSLIEKTGRVFNAHSPDIYTGYAFAYLSKQYVTVGYPLSINGVSSKSNGAAHTSNVGASVRTDYKKLLSGSAIKWPQSLPEIYDSYLGIIEPFVQLAVFFPELNKYISRKKIYRIIIDKLEADSEQDLGMKLEKIISSAENDRSLHKWLVAYVEKNRPAVNPGTVPDLETRVGFDGSHLVLDASKFALENVYDVSKFTRNIFGTLKEKNYSARAYLPLLRRIKKAAGIVLRAGS